MLDLALHSTVVDEHSLGVGYSCPCGCTPAITYRRGDAAALEGCCCGNEFAVGPDAAMRVSRRPGFDIRLDSVPAPWAEVVPVAWAIGPSAHPAEDHDHDGVESDIVVPST